MRHHVLQHLVLYLFLWKTIQAASLDFQNFRSGREVVQCDVIIAGGGPSGIYSSYVLSTYSNTNLKICLAEKDDRLGGKVVDIPGPDYTPSNNLKFGRCPLRVLLQQQTVRCLLNELGVKAQFVPSFSIFDVIHASGKLQGQSTASDQINDNNNLFYKFRNGNETWVMSLLYPVGGWSLIMDKLISRVYKNNVDVFLQQEITQIDDIKGSHGDYYQVITEDYVLVAPKLIMGIPPKFLSGIGGNLVQELIKQEQFKAIYTFPATTIDIWWGTRWWEPYLPSVQTAASYNESIYNGIMVNASNTCLSAFEIYVNPYLKGQNATRVAYTYVPECCKYWSQIFLTDGIQGVEDKVVYLLQDLFPQASVPKPRKVYYNNQQQAFQSLSPGYENFSYDAIQQWAKRPQPGKNVCLIGDSFHLSWTGWINGAVQSFLECAKDQYTDIIPLSKLDEIQDCGKSKFDTEEAPENVEIYSAKDVVKLNCTTVDIPHTHGNQTMTIIKF